MKRFIIVIGAFFFNSVLFLYGATPKGRVFLLPKEQQEARDLRERVSTINRIIDNLISIVCQLDDNIYTRTSHLSLWKDTLQGCPSPSSIEVILQEVSRYKADIQQAKKIWTDGLGGMTDDIESDSLISDANKILTLLADLDGALQSYKDHVATATDAVRVLPNQS